MLVFGQLNDYNSFIWPSGNVSQLPINITYQFEGQVYQDVWQAIITSGSVRIQMTDNLNYFNSTEFFVSQFRCVIVPGGVSVPLGISYKELKTWLHANIPD